MEWVSGVEQFDFQLLNVPTKPQARLDSKRRQLDRESISTPCFNEAFSRLRPRCVHVIVDLQGQDYSQILAEAIPPLVVNELPAESMIRRVPE
jgi:hypothetical protein